MKQIFGLSAAACLVLPVLAHAQPVTGPYVSLGAGTSIMNPTNVNFQGGGPTGRYLFRPSYAGVAGIGYGFGDGFRVALEGDLMRNTAHEADLAFSGGSTNHYVTTGGEYKYGPMVNLYYDVNVGLPIYPFIGAGVGYQWVKYNHDLTTSFGPGVDVRTGGTNGSFAFDFIAGVSYPLPMVPGLSLTAQYRFMELTASRNYSGYGAAGGAVYQGAVKIGQESSHTVLLGLRYQIFNPPPPAPPAPAPVPVAAPAPAPAKTYLVFFDWDKYNLTPRAKDVISEAASDSKTAQVTTIDVSGYTDTSGSATYNMGLSERRAKTVAAQLVADGVPASEIETKWFGETHLLVPTGPNVREPQNRRVEIVMK